MDQTKAAAGSARLHVVDGVALLMPDRQVFDAMLAGWANQQAARNLSFGTIENRANVVRGFAAFTNTFPWSWSAQMVDEWLADLRSIRHLRKSTLRNYQTAVRMFCDFVTDPNYGWAAECERRFGTHPVQVVHEWNTAVHVQQAEGDPRKRALSVDELQAFFDAADDRVVRIRGRGRKGWLPAFRDSALFKTSYAYGLRRNETRMLDLADFGRNPHVSEFGARGVCHVRFGKAMKGSPPKRRSVLTVFGWTPVVLEEWADEIRPLLTRDGNAAFWPSERVDRVSLSRIDAQFAAVRDEIGLDKHLDFHSLRRSYITHLIEDGWDPLFVQQQAGHEHASTTAIYTCVSSDFRTRVLRQTLDKTMAAALAVEGGTK